MQKAFRKTFVISLTGICQQNSGLKYTRVLSQFLTILSAMTQDSPCYKCGNTTHAWGKDPMNIICNACYLVIEKLPGITIVSSQELCTNCIYWISADQKFGKCRNSHSRLYNTFTPVSESCSQFLNLD
jgi:ribosomal protein S27E